MRCGYEWRAVIQWPTAAPATMPGTVAAVRCDLRKWVRLVNELMSARLQKRPWLRLAKGFTVIGLVTMALVPLIGSDSHSSAAAADSCSPDPQAYDSGGLPSATYPNDPLFARQWGLEQINASEAWSQGARGAGAIIAVVDSGVDLAHPDLTEKLVPGVDFYSKITGHVDCPGPQDDNGHGTGVAGVAAASANNGIGIAGTAPNARVMPLRVAGPTTPEGLVEGIVQALHYAADKGADVINLSIAAPVWMWETIYPLEPGEAQQLRDAVQYAWERGSVIVVASGHLAPSDPLGAPFTSPFCAEPATSRQVVCVAATDKQGQPALHSSLPVQDPGVEPAVALRAPGGLDDACEGGPPADQGIWTTWWPVTEVNECGQGISGAIDGYVGASGGSFSTAFVSGVAALLAGKGLTNQEIVQCLKLTSSNKGTYDPVMGYGIVDAGAAVGSCLK